jgi:hypothetical protein
MGTTQRRAIGFKQGGDGEKLVLNRHRQSVEFGIEVVVVGDGL